MSNRVVSFQIGGMDGKAITAVGGEVMICTAGKPEKIALVDNTGASIANPVNMTNGRIYAEIPKANTSVDLFIRSPGGHFRVVKGHVPGSASQITLPTNDYRTTYVIPFSVADSTPATEKDSGFDLATDAQVNPLGAGIEVTTLEAGKTVLFGMLSTESGGVAAGLGNGLSLAAVGFVPAVATTTTGVIASTTLGSLLTDFVAGTNADDRGVAALKSFRSNGTSKSISYTISTGSTVAEGYIILPVELGGQVALAN